MTKYDTHFETETGIVVMFDDDTVKQIDSTNPFWDGVKEKIYAQKFDELFISMDLASRISEYSDGLFHAVDGRVFVGSDELPEALGEVLIRLANANAPVKPLINFWDNLKKNPSADSVKHLYGFISANHVTITMDGCFIAYKRVDNDFKDCHTHTIDNSIGAVVTMDRDTVDPDPTVTCSKGLHGAAFEYAKNFYPNGILVEIKISPEDVVTVPSDYNQQKMRICKYIVLRECEGEREELIYSGDDDVDTDYDDDDVDDQWVDEDDYIDDIDREDEDDENVWEADDDDDNNADSIVVKPDARGRVAIAKAFTEKLGVKPCSWVNALVKDNTVVISDNSHLALVPSRNDLTVYTVDRSGNIRVTRSMLAKAGLENYKSFTVSYNAGDNTIVIS
jgi:hypothetical protein